MRSTDVKHSIAGFYYQLLIACYELVAIHDKHDGYVGVECGADIRVNYGNDKFIEAKFYKQNTFSRYQEAIRHTIYNFYHTYKDTTPSDSFHIRTNVPISNADKGFFEQWNQGIFPKPEEYILFIKDCLVYEYIKKDPIKKTFDQFKEEYIKNHPDQKQPKYIQALLKYLHQSPQEYERYIDKTILMSDEEILKFIKKVSFECPNHKIDKYDSVLALKEKTEQRLEVYYPGLSKLEYENIRYLIMDSFLDSTVDINRSIVKVNTISEIVVNQKTAIIKLLENDSLAKTMREIEKELIKYEKMLKRKGHSEKMETILKVVNICTEQWIQEMNLFGEKSVSNRYLMGAEQPYPLNILNLFKAMGEIYSLAQQELGTVRITNLQGINNINFDSYKSFSLRTTPSSTDRDDEYTLMTSFIDHTLKEQEMLKAIGNETIVLDADCKICEFDKDNIEDIIMDISKPYSTMVQQEYYQSFQYKCTKCIKLLSHDESCPFAKNFKEGK